MTESSLSDCLMIKLEGESIESFNPDPAIHHWFDLGLRRPGTGQSKENIKDSKEVAVHDEAINAEVSGEAPVEDEVAMIQDEEENNENIEYELVENAEDDSDYNSDFDSEEEDMDEIFEKISKY